MNMITLCVLVAAIWVVFKIVTHKREDRGGE